jgi:hypothetical protein
MNCPHSPDGWCLACVQKTQAEVAVALSAAGAAIQKMQADYEAALAALKPFADACDDECDLPDDTRIEVKYGPMTDYGCTLGDLRRARDIVG